MMNPEELFLEEPIQEPKDLADLGWIGRRIAANIRQVIMIDEFRRKEMEKISACCDEKIRKLNDNSSFLRGMAESFLRGSGYCYANRDARKYDMPGIGAFRFSTTRESIVSTEYDSADPDTQKIIQSEYPDYFRTTVKVAPDKKIIGEAIKAGLGVKGFGVSPKQETFDFVE